MHLAKWAALCKLKEKGGMGFRDIQRFNKALLAKQVWRMVKNPESLVARVFKARYFRNEDVMSVVVKSNASFAWRSLAWSRSIMEKGKCWSIGDGRDISVFKDSWVVGLHKEKLEWRGGSGSDQLRVSDLITREGCWDEKQLNNMFLPFEVEGILNTPIGEKGAKDEVRWKFDEKGSFSVKSAYLVEMGFYDSNPQTSSPDRKMWSKMVWNVSIPPKAKIFLWRAYSNIIPTAANLKAHHVPTDGICSMCRGRWGSTEHCLLFCPKIAGFWKSLRFWSVLKRGDGLLLFDIGWAIRKEFGADEYELWAVMVWQVWIFVCRKTHESKEKVEEISEHTCIALWDAYQAARPTLSATNHLGVCLGEAVWRRPRRDRYRVDVDSLFNKELNLFGVGVIVRNSEGEIVVAMSKRTGPSSSIMMAEVMAVVHGIVLCIEHHVEPVEIFTDSILAARLMADPEEEDQLLPDDVCDILRCARENFLIGVYHMLRAANKAAHSLAQIALSCTQPMCWTARFPSWLRDVVLDDVS